MAFCAEVLMLNPIDESISKKIIFFIVMCFIVYKFQVRDFTGLINMTLNKTGSSYFLLKPESNPRVKN